MNGAGELVHTIPAATPRPVVVLSCEHASNHLLPGWSWPAADHRLRDDHWAWDPGAAPITRGVAAALGAPAVLAGFSRLVVDPNRPLDSETLFRREADGLAIELNRSISPTEREERLARCYGPYHAAFDAMVAAHPGADVVSIHTFTPCYEGQRREVEVGVLFDHDDAYGEAWLAALADCGYRVAANDPWSGKQGLMYSPQLHAARGGVRAVEFEFRQDLATDPAHVARFVTLLAEIAPRLARR